MINGHVINEISLDDMSYVNTTPYSLLWNTLRPDDGPVHGPKHVVLVINIPLSYLLCIDSTTCTILSYPTQRGCKLRLKVFFPHHSPVLYSTNSPLLQFKVTIVIVVNKSVTLTGHLTLTQINYRIMLHIGCGVAQSILWAGYELGTRGIMLTHSLP